MSVQAAEVLRCRQEAKFEFTIDFNANFKMLANVKPALTAVMQAFVDKLMQTMLANIVSSLASMRDPGFTALESALDCLLESDQPPLAAIQKQRLKDEAKLLNKLLTEWDEACEVITDNASEWTIVVDEKNEAIISLRWMKSVFCCEQMISKEVAPGSSCCTNLEVASNTARQNETVVPACLRGKMAKMLAAA